MCTKQKSNWLAKVQLPFKEQIWVGNFQAHGREDAKIVAKKFVATYYNDDVKIIFIAEGVIDVNIVGRIIPFDE